MQFYFKHEPQNIEELRKVTSVISEDKKFISKGKLLILYSVGSNGPKNVIRLVHGSTVGADVAYVVGQDDLFQLPILGRTYDASSPEFKIRYELVYESDVAATGKIYQLFAGNMSNSQPSMTTFHPDADSVLEALSNAKKSSQKIVDAYCIRYEYGVESTYLPLI